MDSIIQFHQPIGAAHRSRSVNFRSSGSHQNASRTSIQSAGLNHYVSNGTRRAASENRQPNTNNRRSFNQNDRSGDNTSNWIIEPVSISAILHNKWNYIRCDKGGNRVGRMQTAKINIVSQITRPLHASLLILDGKLFLRDNSKNGTTVIHMHINDYSIYKHNAAPIRIWSGDWISFETPNENVSPANMQWFRLLMRGEAIQEMLDREARPKADWDRERLRRNLFNMP